MIVPLELWDAEVDGASLYARRADAGFFDSLARVAETVDCSDVALVGGGVDAARARPAFVARGLALAFVSEDPFFAAEAGRAFADTVVDVGQTSLKAVGPNGRRRFPRAEPFITSIVEAILAVGGESVLVALPCAIEGNALGDSSYPTRGSLATFVAELRARTGHERIDVVNDAVLAARAVPRPHQGRRLVLTVGHGVGAAVIAP
jgi:hypothetical protein